MPRTAIRPRKTPVQKRSADLVAAILQAAIRVLEEEGAHRFTTIRVAERAGVSVGSLYQYFPNKQAILFRLQEDEWKQTSDMLHAILADPRLSATERLREAMRAFFRSEHDEAPLRRALGAIAPRFRDSPVAQEQQRESQRLLRATLAEAAPNLTRRQLAFAGELYVATMGALGKHVTDDERSPREVARWADASADMFLAHLAELDRG